MSNKTCHRCGMNLSVSKRSYKDTDGNEYCWECCLVLKKIGFKEWLEGETKTEKTRKIIGNFIKDAFERVHAKEV